MQTKKRSMIETVVNTAVGLVINITAQRLVFPLFDMHISVHENLLIAAIFTVISIIRSYCMRRVFNAWEIRIHKYKPVVDLSRYSNISTPLEVKMPNAPMGFKLV